MLKRAQMYYDLFGFKGLAAIFSAKTLRRTQHFKWIRAGYDFPMWMRIPSSDTAVYDKVFVNREYDFEVESAPKVIVDGGANIGLASVYFAKKYPNSKVIAIEPERLNFEVLLKNTAPYGNIYPLRAALWNHDGFFNLCDPGFGNWAFQIKDDSSEKAESDKILEKVQAFSIQGLMQSLQITTIDILKIDIEGAERELFEDTSQWIENVNSIIVELHERSMPGCEASFSKVAPKFPLGWQHGENHYLSRENCLKKPLGHS